MDKYVGRKCTKKQHERHKKESMYNQFQRGECDFSAIFTTSQDKILRGFANGPAPGVTCEKFLSPQPWVYTDLVKKPSAINRQA